MAITPERARFIAAWLGGASIVKAAQAAGVCRDTGQRWSTDPEIQAELHRAVGPALENAYLHFTSMLYKAWEVMSECMDDQDSRVRLNAARAITQTAVALARHAPAAPREVEPEASREEL